MHIPVEVTQKMHFQVSIYDYLRLFIVEVFACSILKCVQWTSLLYYSECVKSSICPWSGYHCLMVNVNRSWFTESNKRSQYIMSNSSLFLVIYSVPKVAFWIALITLSMIFRIKMSFKSLGCTIVIKRISLINTSFWVFWVYFLHGNDLGWGVPIKLCSKGEWNYSLPFCSYLFWYNLCIDFGQYVFWIP